MPIAAKMGDVVTATDTHIVVNPSGAAAPVTLPFNGTITGGCSSNVLIDGQPAATVGSTAQNNPPHIPPGGAFQIPPTNQGTVIKGSGTVLINNKPAARVGDTVQTCNDPAPAPVGTIQGAGTVDIGG